MSNPSIDAIGLGVIAGMRSMAAPAFVSQHFANHPETGLAASPLRGLASPKTAGLLAVLALGELVGDKLPNTPNRTSPGALGGRAVSGGVCGAAVFLAADKSATVGAAIGTVVAIASTFTTYWLRRRAGEVSKIPDPALAVVEDALVFTLGVLLFDRR